MSTDTVTLKITKSQLWLLVRATVSLTEDGQLMKLQEEYPDLDVDAMVVDFNQLIKVLVKHTQSQGARP